MIDAVLKLRYLPCRDTLLIAVLSILLISGLFIVQGDVGFSLSDEGYLWYGVQRVMLGEVPIRDFMAYDPGRYYWSAALMKVFGDNGILALRGAVAVFQVAGLYVGLRLISGADKKHDLFYIILSSITLIVWMFPRHKLFDITLSILLIGLLAYLVKQPDSRRHFLAGVGIGLIAVFGRNHGMYGVVGAVCVVFWLSLKQAEGMGLAKKLTRLIAGIAVGFMPIVIMVIAVPEFGVAFLDSISFLFEVKSTNLPLPIPWPWLVDFSDIPIGNAIRNVFIGLLFMGLILFGILSIAWLIWQRLHDKPVSPVFVAASFLALPYAHFAYSRADISHLAQAIFPFLIGCLALFATRPVMLKWTGAASLCLVSLWVMHYYHPGWQCYARFKCVDVNISGDALQVDRRTAADVDLLRELAERYAPNDKSFVVAPYWPGAYALLERKSPLWEIFALFPRSQDFENTEIERMKMAKPGFVFIYDKALNQRDELRFSNTHPITYKYVLDNFTLLPDSTNPAYQTYVNQGYIK